jgi:hypothetical protein
MTPYVKWDEDGHAHWFHMCNGELNDYRLNTRWVDSKENNSVAPSLACTECGTHGFWTDGHWNSL